MSETLSDLRSEFRAQKFASQQERLQRMQQSLQTSSYDPVRVSDDAAAIVRASREQRSRQGTLDAFLHQFGLSNQEGITLMCLAESLLRIPDAATQDALIAERISKGNWEQHRGHSEKLFVNAGVWGLMLSGRMLRADQVAERDPAAWLGRLIARSGEGVIRAAIRQGMLILGGQFVFGRTIEEALHTRQQKPLHERCYSFDMLGEGARTAGAAARYFELYANAIDALGADPLDTALPLQARSSISIKLSALHPRYAWAQRERVMNELLPRVTTLAKMAARNNLPLTIDAEEADRLDLSLDVFEILARAPELDGWQGLGLAVQAYQKRGEALIAWLDALAVVTGRCIPVRLVKGAYWDSEIKHAQQLSLPDYPVFTRKDASDLSYLACAQRLFRTDGRLYPQFATHNAHSIAAVHRMADGRPFEYQRLHGMGELLYRAVRVALPAIQAPLRVYAPVGAYQDLLPYLVRRLLENGANSSFVHRFLEEDLPVAEVVRDPTISLQEPDVLKICPPVELFGAERKNSRGLDLSDPSTLGPLLGQMEQLRSRVHSAACLVNGEAQGTEPKPSYAPAQLRHQLGEVCTASPAHCEQALRGAVAAQKAWDALPLAERAGTLRRFADALEAEPAPWLDLLTREAGRTLPDAIAEWREAIDFCRYYAQQAEDLFAAREMPGPTGESNILRLFGRGVFLCISPWNFPLAIFVGQVVAALVCGNSVIAKPAEQTPIIATQVVAALHASGVPAQVLQLLLGNGEQVAEPLVRDERIAGVVFTGSVATAKRIQRTLAARPGAIVPLIAETGGQNAMVVDSTALPEQVCDDVLESAFGSAGQRCSALRILLLQSDIADHMQEMLREALAERKLGLPWELATDIGPVIDAQAHARLAEHIDWLETHARRIARLEVPQALKGGTYFGPQIYEIDGVARLHEEVFGPILHIVRWDETRLESELEALRRTGFALTLGIHTRLERRQNALFDALPAGNVYVNRGMTGAVVGVQPFGGSGLSGTGPKAGGPHYLSRFVNERTLSTNTAAVGGNAELFRLASDAR